MNEDATCAASSLGRATIYRRADGSGQALASVEAGPVPEEALGWGLG